MAPWEIGGFLQYFITLDFKYSNLKMRLTPVEVKMDEIRLF